MTTTKTTSYPYPYRAYRLAVGVGFPEDPTAPMYSEWLRAQWVTFIQAASPDALTRYAIGCEPYARHPVCDTPTTCSFVRWRAQDDFHAWLAQQWPGEFPVESIVWTVAPTGQTWYYEVQRGPTHNVGSANRRRSRSVG